MKKGFEVLCAPALRSMGDSAFIPRNIHLDNQTPEKCVEGLKNYCIDVDGNVYGVCCGSAYSYREEYYKDDLPWVLNDTHGTGIVLIAIVEVERNKQL